MAETAQTISVLCPCGKKLKAPATAVGKKAKCPTCGNIVVVKPPAPAAVTTTTAAGAAAKAPSKPKPKPKQEEDNFDALYDLADQGEQAAANQQLNPRCPGCMRELEPGAVICVNCGYDTRSGKSIKPKVETTTPKPSAMANGKKKPVDKMAPQGSFMKGLAACVVAAVVGSFGWALVPWLSGYRFELPFLLLIVGGLAGAGMAWGQEGYSYLGGFTAAGVTFVVIILARIAVVFAIIIPILNDEAADEAALQHPDLSMYDERVVEQLTEEALKGVKAPPAGKDEDEDDVEEKRLVEAERLVEAKLKKMPKPQYDAMVKKLDEEERDDELLGLLTDEIIKKQMNKHPDSASTTEWQQAQKSAREQFAKLSRPQRDAEHKRLSAAEAAERQQQMEVRKKEIAARRARGEDDGSSAAGVAAGIVGFAILYLVVGGIKGGLCLIGALFLAYRTASGSVSDS